MQRKITIVGGNGSMGQLFSHYFDKLGFLTQSLDKNDWNNAKYLLENVDLVIISVPIENTISIIDEVCKYITENTILADFTSIKESIQLHMEKKFSGAILSLHPMFGPTISSPKSQVILNCGGRQNSKADWFIQGLKQIGFNLINISARKHDKAMSFIQGIEHFSTFVLGTFLKEHKLSPQDLFSIASPIYQTKLAMLGRIFDQDASLYADIIMSNNERISLIEEYSIWLQHWVEKLKNNKRSEFIKEFEETSSWMGDFTHQSQTASDKFLTDFTENLKQEIN